MVTKTIIFNDMNMGFSTFSILSSIILSFGLLYVFRGKFISPSNPTNVIYKILQLIKGFICLHSIKKLYNVFKQLTKNNESMRILIFLSLNLTFMFVEIIVGLSTNSLGLLSDASHMLCDNGALIIGLIASYVSKWPKNESFSFGYGKIEILSGFINSIILVFMSTGIMKESMKRFFNPQDISSQHLVITSIVGLIINIIGLFCFHSHSHFNCNHSFSLSNKNRNHLHGASRKKKCDSHTNNHMSSHKQHESESCNKSCNEPCSEPCPEPCPTSMKHNNIEKKDKKSYSIKNCNLQAIYLHILADTMGSLGVTISSLLIKYKKWYISDSICSLLLSSIILITVFPLLRSTFYSLMDSLPEEYNKETITKLLNEISNVSTIEYINNIHVHYYHFWKISQNQSIGCIKISIYIHSSKDYNKTNIYNILQTKIEKIIYSYLELEELTLQLDIIE